MGRRIFVVPRSGATLLHLIKIRKVEVGCLNYEYDMATNLDVTTAVLSSLLFPYASNLTFAVAWLDRDPL
jgi:hypothetical protein